MCKAIFDLMLCKTCENVDLYMTNSNYCQEGYGKHAVCESISLESKRPIVSRAQLSQQECRACKIARQGSPGAAPGTVPKLYAQPVEPLIEYCLLHRGGHLKGEGASAPPPGASMSQGEPPRGSSSKARWPSRRSSSSSTSSSQASQGHRVPPQCPNPPPASQYPSKPPAPGGPPRRHPPGPGGPPAGPLSQGYPHRPRHPADAPEGPARHRSSRESGYRPGYSEDDRRRGVTATARPSRPPNSSGSAHPTEPHRSSRQPSSSEPSYRPGYSEDARRRGVTVTARPSRPPNSSGSAHPTEPHRSSHQPSSSEPSYRPGYSEDARRRGVTVKVTEYQSRSTDRYSSDDERGYRSSRRRNTGRR
ncbi:hypothetical protein LEL_09709 [Akanthomyces lecanii RCEF 1005]|uniref:Uncharacterized protein n=1 Tax=Akanthomyces lecanii RCEF 1005 TaxID=1081108 RepID=A0A168C9L1_CORDF|nr:hypothetical protein LEL_09709 [Akanthomyces lecanii RCEF 1005]